MNNLSKIPQVEILITEQAVQYWVPLISRPLVVQSVREVLEQVRNSHKQGSPIPSHDTLIDCISAACRVWHRRRTIPVINCTGVLVHTNLGRAPLSSHVWEAAAQVNCGYSSIEFNLAAGVRGNRSGVYTELIRLITGAEASLLVNNNAAAVFLMLSAFAQGKEVIISRGELVQIGGGFRIPDILRQSGAKLIEVGTTNITTIDDYLSPINGETAMVLCVHRSNFAMRGFAKSPSISELAKCLPKHVMLAVDQGSGTLGDGVPGEIPVSACLNMGADLVSFSGDKVLGSVQAGCIAGRTDLIAELGRHPLYRVLRPGKTTISLFEEALIERLNGQKGVPLTYAGRSLQTMQSMGRKIIRGMDRSVVALVEAPLTLGGGSTPDEALPGIAVEITLPVKPEDVLKAFRELDTPIIGTIYRDKVRLHLGAVASEEVAALRTSLRQIVDTFLCT